jgi:hypothetical protein
MGEGIESREEEENVGLLGSAKGKFEGPNEVRTWS